FVGYFPADNPQYTCMVMVNAPSKGIYYGALVAGPVFKEIADKVYSANMQWQSESVASATTESNDLPLAKTGFTEDIRTIYNHFGISSHEKNNAGEEEKNEWVTAETEDLSIALLPKKFNAELVPDLKGMGLRDALYLLENSGLKVIAEGTGKVKEQSLIPGQKIVKGMLIHLKLG
ncbi:MAG: PASTA domain-containing protein, partial [Bacteroidia bacterium]